MKDRGSALILAILLLTFFMAISLNMFYISQKKSERSAYKAIGTNDLTIADSGSSIGYYELALASRYVTAGVVNVSVFDSSGSLLTGRNVKTGSYDHYFTEYYTGTDAEYDDPNFDNDITGIVTATGSDGDDSGTPSGTGFEDYDTDGTERLTGTTRIVDADTTDTDDEISIGGYRFTGTGTINGVDVNLYEKQIKIIPWQGDSNAPIRFLSGDFVYKVVYAENQDNLTVEEIVVTLE